MHEANFDAFLLRGRTGTHSDCGQHEPSDNSRAAAPGTSPCSPDACCLHGLPQPCPPAICTFSYAGKQSEQGRILVSTLLTYCMWQVEKGPHASKYHSRNSNSLSFLSSLSPPAAAMAFTADWKCSKLLLPCKRFVATQSVMLYQDSTHRPLWCCEGRWLRP